MIGIILVLIVLWITKKKLTQGGMISICAVAAYMFAYLEGIGGDAYGQDLVNYVALRGTIYLVLNLAISWLVFRKKIKAAEARKLAEEEIQQPSEDAE